MQDIDLARLAEATGCLGIRVDDPSQIQSAIEQAVASDRPAVVDVKTDMDGIAQPPLGPD